VTASDINNPKLPDFDILYHLLYLRTEWWPEWLVSDRESISAEAPFTPATMSKQHCRML